MDIAITCNKNIKYADLSPWHRTPESQDLQNRLIVDAFENGTLDDFKSNEDIWYDNIDELGLFFENHKKRPVETSIDETEQNLSHWLSRQSSYRMRYHQHKKWERHGMHFEPNTFNIFNQMKISGTHVFET